MKQPVVLIHGMWSTPDTLEQLADVFDKQQYEVHCPALPGHLPTSMMGEAERAHLIGQGLDDYVDTIVDFIQTLDVPPVIIGHSMGGLIAQLAAQHVDCVALIAISSAPPAGINGWTWSVMRTFGSNLFKFPLWKRLTELKRGNIAFGIANSQPEEVHQQIFATSTYESGRASFQIGMWFLFSDPPSRLDAKKVLCPVLVIGGTEDRITPFKVQEKIARLYGDRCTLKALSGACHWTIADGNLGATQQVILTWMQSANLQELQ